MNVLILNWRDIKHPFSGGAEISLFEHAKYWKKKGAEVTWVSSTFRDALAKETVEGILIYRTGSVYTVHLRTFFAYISGKYRDSDIIIDSFHFIPYFSIFYQLFSQVKVIGLLNEVAGKLWFSNLPYVLAMIGYLTEPFMIRLYRNKTFITGSDSARDNVIKLGLREPNIQVVNHGVHIVRIPKTIKKEEKPTVLFLGRISYDKGIKDACKTVCHVLEKIPEVQFWIAGKEEKKGILGKLLNEYPELKNITTYFGFVDEKTKFELYKKAWMLIHPSEKEGWGLTVIEAASQGTPTVGYNVEGLRDSIRNNETGILVQPGNCEALAKGILQLVKNPEQYNKISKHGVEWSKQFSWEKSVEKSWSILEKEMGKNEST